MTGDRTPSRPWPFVLVTLGLWAGVLPAVLVVDEGRGVVFRGGPAVAAGMLIVLAGACLIVGGAGHLASRGVRLFGMAPGAVLVTDGWYGRIRNPIDLGTTLVAVGVWAVLAVELIWVLPVAALVHFAVGAGLYEDRRLAEVFGDDFAAYRRAVPKWVPRRR